jgi:hypothetical protein
MCERGEIEITPEMKEAGAAALEEFSGSYSDVMLVEAVYIAMRLAYCASTTESSRACQ